MTDKMSKTERDELRRVVRQDLVDEMLATAHGYTCEWRPLDVPYIRTIPEKREEMRRAAYSSLRSRVASATLRVHRQEADLLKSLATDALQSDAAQAFLAAIPTVAELVPAARLEELEAEFTPDTMDDFDE